MVAEIGWWTLALAAGLVAALAAVFLGRKDTPRWLSAPLFVAATALAGVGGFQSILDLRNPALAETDCGQAATLSAEELDALSVLVRGGRAEPKLQRDFACAFAAAIAPKGLSPESRQALVEAAASLSANPEAKTREALVAVQDAGARGAAIDTLLRLAQTADDFKQVGALAAAAETERALTAYRAALELAPQDAAARTQLGNLFLRGGDLQRAEGAFRSVLNQPDQDPAWQAAALTNLADIARAHQDFSAAENLLKQALSLSERGGDREAVARTLTRLGAVARERRDAKAAVDYTARGLALFEQIGRRDEAAAAHMTLGALTRSEAGDAARGHFRAALAGFQRIGDRGGQADAYSALGRLALVAGDGRGAEKQLKRALALQEDLGRKPEMAATLTDLGQAARQRRRYDAADERLRQALDLAERLGRKDLLGRVLEEMGALALAQNRLEPADGYLRRALTLYGEVSAPQAAAAARVNLARVLARRGEAAQAKSELERAVETFEAHGAAADAERARAELSSL